MNEVILRSMTEQQHTIRDTIRNYGKKLFNFIHRRVPDEQEAQDILQDVWYQLLTVIDVQPVEQISAWLYRVTTNRIIDSRRKQKALSADDLFFSDENGDELYAALLLDEELSPDIAYEQEAFRRDLLQALELLPEKQRDVFIWNELDKQTLQEIADKTGEKLKTIISRKRYAVARLKEILSDWDE